MVASTTAEHEVSGSIPGSVEVFLDFTVKKFPAVESKTVMENIERKPAYQGNVLGDM